MKRNALFTIGLLALASIASADVYICQESGKKVYQDKPCPGQGEVLPGIKTRRAEPQSAPTTDPECRFRYTTLDGGKSKALAENAKEECLHNKEFKKAGQADGVRLDAYQLWKDDRDTRRAVANETQRRGEAVMKSFQRPLRMTCTPNNRGRLDCE